MKPCDSRWNEELREQAAGSAPASAALKEHLAACGVCAATLEEWKVQMERIDHGIQGMATPEPSPHAVARIMAEARQDREGAWLQGWRLRALALGAVAVVVAMAIDGWRIERRSAEEKLLSSAEAIANWQSPTGGLLHSSNDRWLNSTPQLGSYFYQFNTNVPEKEPGKELDKEPDKEKDKP
jgi:hypothetical protein